MLLIPVRSRGLVMVCLCVGFVLRVCVCVCVFVGRSDTLLPQETK